MRDSRLPVSVSDFLAAPVRADGCCGGGPAYASQCVTLWRYGGYHRRVKAYRRRKRRAFLHRRASPAAKDRKAARRRPAAKGLSQGEVATRVERGLTNRVPDTTSRSLWQIFRANVFTLFNAIVGTSFLLLLFLGQWRDALFGLAAVSNAVIGVVEEYRAKKSLDRLAVLNAPLARVLREGRSTTSPRPTS